MTNTEMLMAENFALKEKLSGICKVYSKVRPVLKVLRFFSFIKSGGKIAIDAAISVLDEACSL